MDEPNLRRLLLAATFCFDRPVFEKKKRYIHFCVLLYMYTNYYTMFIDTMVGLRGGKVRETQNTHSSSIYLPLL